MNFSEALNLIDELEAGEVTPDDIEELSRQLERAGIAARHEMIGVWRAQGWEPEEIEDGVAQLEKALQEMSAEAIARLELKRETIH